MALDKAVSRQDIKELIPARDSRGNKSTFGRVLIAAGSRCMAGAAYLSALAALRTGAGLVKVMTPEDNRIIIQTLLPEALLESYEPEKLNESFIERSVNWADVIVIGPGLGISDHAVRLVRNVFILSEQKKIPLIVDADALNITAYNKLILPKDCCITPHIGEMARLTNLSTASVKADRNGCASEFSKSNGITVVLKDHETCIAAPDGRYTVNASGSSALAKGGSGDVLTGVIAALMAQGMKTYEAARLGAFLHGMAGRECALEKSEYGVLAHEVADMIPEIIRKNI